MIQAQHETNDLLRALVENWNPVVVEQVDEPVSPVGQPLDSLSNLSKVEIQHKLVALPSKKQQAIEWLQQHPEDRNRAGQDLEIHVFPMGESISYRTWNRAKSELE